MYRYTDGCYPRYSAHLQQQSCVISQVKVEVKNISWNSRQLSAAIQIQAPRASTWKALTNYDKLDDFIPGLTINNCLERRPTGALLLQVGEQDVALGARFTAKVILDIHEYKGGIPKDQWQQQIDYNASSNPWDISFQMVEGDFKVFNGVWRMEECDINSCNLQYYVYVSKKLVSTTNFRGNMFYRLNPKVGCLYAQYKAEYRKRSR
eukprot:TRINITY_DN25223_c0_g1_i1.p2 TRINITY_DN25223_c0_g1~~TRINITY_DN25223_c0_g1_i1.p2  ORF type:complete len:228 (-),score=1.69 TRINITY_DN25223_c0_g1_i1:117-737(-)